MEHIWVISCTKSGDSDEILLKRTPPAPPLWKYSSSDLRAFSRWEKKIRIWQLQVRNYVSAADSALMLFTSLTGEAEQEVEHIDLAKVNTKDGVDYLLDALRGPLQQKELFQKRKLLSDYEMVGRMNHESFRQYINRYRRCIFLCHAKINMEPEKDTLR